MNKELGRYKKKVLDDAKEIEKLREEAEGYKEIVQSYKSLLEAIIFKLCKEHGEFEIDLDDVKEMFKKGIDFETELKGRKYKIKLIKKEEQKE